jgi:hypothetical protein
MSIEFMVIGAPRSGTAWCANWLTTQDTLCLHDMLFRHTPEDLDKIPCTRTLGLADSGLWRFPEWVAAHPAKKVILHRRDSEIRDSLRRAGLPDVDPGCWRALHDMVGLHIDWRVLFDGPEMVHHYLFGNKPVDLERHTLLTHLNVQADFEKIDPDPAVTRKLLERMRVAQ